MASGNGPDEAARRPGLLSFPIHPALVAAYPILYLFARNLGEVDPAEVVGPLVVSIGLAVALVAGFRLLRVGTRRAALIASIVAVVILFFGQFVEAVRPLRVTETRLLIAWFGVAFVLVIVVLRVRRDLAAVTALVNLIAGVVVAFQLVTIVSGLAGRPPSTAGAPAATASPTAAPSVRPPTDAGQRDVYYLVVEDYGSQRTIGQYLGIEDDGFFSWLTDKGFEVLPDTRSNYGRTPLSMASSLNMTYLDEVARAQGPNSDSYAPVNEMVKFSAAARFLKERGYAIAQLGSQYYLTARGGLADVNPVFRQTSDFLAVLYESTVLPPIATRLGFGDAFSERRLNYEAATWGLDEFPKLRDLPGPKFVFYHLFLPHHPFVVDANGNYVTARDDAKRTPREQYQTQWSFVHRELRKLIEPLLALPEVERPIIIFTTDEGPNPEGMPTIEGDLDWSQATDAQLDQKFSIFAAYYLPGVSDSGLYPGLSSVNSFRLVFNHYFDADLPLLPDRNYIHRDKHHPYVLTDVTDRLPPPTR
jgi:hypothetical protein